MIQRVRAHACAMYLGLGVVSICAQVAPAGSATSSAAGGANGVADVTDTDWKFVTRLSTVASYDDNVFIQPNDERHDVYFHLAPSLAAGIGTFRAEIAPFAAIPHVLARTGEEDLPRKDFAYASYTPDFVVFSKYHHEDDVNHDLRLAARKDRDRWNVQGQFRFQSIRDTDIDVGHRVRQNYYTAEARGWHEISGKTNATAGVFALHSDLTGGFTSTDVRGNAGLEYQIAPKTAVGLGGTAGFLAVNRGGDQTYGQPLLQLRYNPTGKLSFTGQAGEEFRHFAGAVPNRHRFVFSFSGDYTPSDETTASISARRDTVTSAQYPGENIVADTYQGTVRQRLLTRLYFSLGGGLVHNRYENNRAIVPIGRRDDYSFGKVSASRDITTYGTIELSYEHRDNDSTIPTFGFRQNIASLAASFMF